MTRTRFAPSPTGFLHIGGARTALYNWLFAQHHQGDFILRVEDTDTERSTEEAMNQQLQSLMWLGLHWREGVRPNGEVEVGQFGPYRQSHRSEVYQQMARQLLDAGLAYYCFMTDEEQEAARSASGKSHFQVKSPYRDMSMDEAKAKIAAGEQPSIRFRVSESSKDLFFRDLIRGDIRLTTDMLADFVIIRSNGLPVYNFCCVADDHLMQVTHVLRGEEHLPNTLKQLLLYQAFGWQPPNFGHLSIILGDDGKKLSKRTHAVSMDDYQQMGILPEAMINYLALLGWSHPDGEEVMATDALIEAFSLDRVHASSAQFDMQKLLWLNSEHIKRLSSSALMERSKAWWMDCQLPDDSHWMDQAISLIQSEVKTLSEVPQCLTRLTGTQPIDDSCHEVLSWPTTVGVLSCAQTLLLTVEGDYMDEETFRSMIQEIKQTVGVKGKQLFMPLRCMMIVQANGSELVALIKLVSVRQMLANIERLLQVQA